jgi:hypothetical protein
MKKLFTLLFMSTLFISCSQDNEVVDAEQDALTFEEKLAKGDFDNSNLGIYKGLFTTLDGQERATVFVTLNGISEPSVEFSFPDATKAVVRSNQSSMKGQAVKGMSFDEADFNFTFNVNADGTNPVMENVTYKGQKGDVVMLKETTKAAITTKTGTYTCESGCFTSDDDAVPHPELGAPGARQTFNFMLQGAGDGPITQQYVLNRRTYQGTVLQANCGLDAFGNVRTCGLFAQADLNGNSGPIRFRSLSDPDKTLAFHSYSVNPALDCSTYEGLAVYRSTLFGRSTIAFRTDNGVGDGGDCR